METSPHPDEWTFADGTKLRSFRVGDISLQVHYDDNGVCIFAAERHLDAAGLKTHLTTWHRGEGFSGVIATATSHPDLGSMRPAEPADLNELADTIEAHGSGMPRRMRDVIIKTLRTGAP